MPLWMTAIFPSSVVWGWALGSVGAPWVAQRVWPTPKGPSRPVPLRASAKAESFPERFTTFSPSGVRTATPAESYPRYSSLLRPSKRTSVALRKPM